MNVCVTQKIRHALKVRARVRVVCGWVIRANVWFVCKCLNLRAT